MTVPWWAYLLSSISGGLLAGIGTYIGRRQARRRKEVPLPHFWECPHCDYFRVRASVESFVIEMKLNHLQSHQERAEIE